jgi:cytochrome c oxidase assembly protein subunit 20
MADDTREPTTYNPVAGANEHTASEDSSASRRKTKYELPKSQVGKLWEAFGDPEESANALANTGYKGARKDANDVSVTEAVKSMSLKEVTSFYKAPCARDSLLLGIGAGFGIGGVRGVLGGKLDIFTVKRTDRKTSELIVAFTQACAQCGMPATGPLGHSLLLPSQLTNSASVDESRSWTA